MQLLLVRFMYSFKVILNPLAMLLKYEGTYIKSNFKLLNIFMIFVKSLMVVMETL